MKILMTGESDLVLSHFEEPTFDVEVESGVEVPFSAMQMFATSLGHCTASVMASYGERFDVGIEDLSVRVSWSDTEEPYRIDAISMTLDWPSLPESRIEAARRAAKQCTIHNTLHHPPEIETRVVSEQACLENSPEA